jgi:cell wall-associated NlpC family hydrolase
VKKEPSHESELQTQLLYGQLAYDTGERVGTWTQIKLENDADLYYVLSAQLTPTSAEDAYHLIQEDGTCMIHGRATHLFAGSLIREQEMKEAALFKGPWNTTFIESFLHQLIGSPYTWGGLSSAGIDCSGVSKLLYSFASLELPHSASQQMNFGFQVDFIQQVVPGDLAFFTNQEGEINHVGVMLSSHKIIHASASNAVVAMDDIDQESILHRETGKRSHRLRMIKRLIPKLS